MQVDKDHLKRTLVKSHQENIDYIIINENKRKKRGGHNKEQIYLTVNCFKKVCLKTKSRMADKIINYYIALENLVIEYQKEIISILIRENKLLKADLNPEMYPKSGVIYIIDYVMVIIN